MYPSPGRFNVMDEGKVTVIIEYIPNPSAKEGRLPNE
jgi:UDP-N-acetylmuramyl tripeptide synthase